MTEQPHEPRPAEDLPRRAYFGAIDRAHLANKTVTRDGGTTTDLQAIEAARRVKLAATLQQKAEDVGGAVKSLKALDATGHTEAGVSHLRETVRDLDLALDNLAADIAAALGRIRNRNETVAALQAANPAISRQVSGGILAEAVEVPHPADILGASAALGNAIEAARNDAERAAAPKPAPGPSPAIIAAKLIGARL